MGKTPFGVTVRSCGIRKVSPAGAVWTLARGTGPRQRLLPLRHHHSQNVECLPVRALAPDGFKELDWIRRRLRCILRTNEVNEVWEAQEADLGGAHSLRSHALSQRPGGIACLNRLSPPVVRLRYRPNPPSRLANRQPWPVGSRPSPWSS